MFVRHCFCHGTMWIANLLLKENPAIGLQVVKKFRVFKALAWRLNPLGVSEYRLHEDPCPHSFSVTVVGHGALDFAVKEG